MTSPPPKTYMVRTRICGPSQADPWFQLAFGEGFLVDKIGIYNRNDGDCRYRLKCGSASCTPCDCSGASIGVSCGATKKAQNLAAAIRFKVQLEFGI